MREDYRFCVNGFAVEAHYDTDTVERLFLPLLRRLTAVQRTRGGRLVVFLCAPPGAGKSTLALMLEHLSRTVAGLTPLQAVGLDGFHHRAAYLAAHTVERDGVAVPMTHIKGAPETFDAARLRRTLLRLRQGDVLWPVYDRNIHDVIDDAVQVTADIVLVEGNWLLYNEGAWAEMAALCDEGIFIEAQAEHLRERLIDRKMRGGLSRAAAEAYCDRVDLANVARLMAHHHAARTCWVMDADGTYREEV